MHLFNSSSQRFRPSQHSLPRFALWAVLYTAAVVFLFLLPQASFTWLMLISLGTIAGSQPGSPDRAAKPGTFIAVIVLAASLAVVIGLALWWPSPAASSPEASRGAPMWFRLLMGLGWAIFFVLEFSRFRHLHRPAAAA